MKKIETWWGVLCPDMWNGVGMLGIERKDARCHAANLRYSGHNAHTVEVTLIYDISIFESNETYQDKEKKDNAPR